ncbi:MAG: amidohydrolase [Oscillospiraceae bacterium]|nr:amidohydrolase [Oscillospiraceae bacterium]MCM0708195.1 amidohydrolase [Faecalicatena sp. BF-R-105]MDY3219613.1 amidohydrolase [Candidatus Fimivivens sp.]SFJ57447.1 Imidazolonepropionase [Ruminococcaceae bacterium D5]GKH50954.1 amidohydrolase [Eubacteriales bacterium]
MLITHVHLVPVCGVEIPDGFLRTEGRRIAALGPMQELPAPAAGEEVVDGKGGWLLPGLVDIHSHLGMFGDGMGVEGDDGNEIADPVTPQLRAIDAVNPLDRGFSEALDYGVTTVVTGPGSASPISGQSAAMKTFGCCVDDMVLNPALAMKFALGENPKGTYAPRSQAPTTRMATAALIREELYRAKRYLEDLERYEHDTEDELDPPEYDAKSEALLPVLKREMAVHIHAHRADDIFTAVRLIGEFSLRGVVIHATEGHLIAERFAGFGIPVVCGPVIGSRDKPELVSLSRETPALLAHAGVKVALCTDHPELPQEFLMLSAALCHREGMSRAEALRAVTLTPAEIVGLDHRIGSLAPGKDADLVLYPRDPLSGLERPVSVFLDGKQVRS